MPEPGRKDRVRIDNALRAADVAHAFGARFRLGLSHRRATSDPVTSTSTSSSPSERCAGLCSNALLHRATTGRPQTSDKCRRSGTGSPVLGENPVDLFFSTHVFHDRPYSIIRGAVRRHHHPRLGSDRAGGVQGVLQPHEGLGRHRGDGRCRVGRSASCPRVAGRSARGTMLKITRRAPCSTVESPGEEPVFPR